MSLLSGDLTTPERAALWIPSLNPAAAGLPMMISAYSNMILGKLNRARLYSQTFVRTIDGVGNYQIILPDYPVTSITSLQIGATTLQVAPLPAPGSSIIPPNTFGYGYRWVPWSGNLPGDPVMVEFLNGVFWAGVQNIKVTYVAGYLISEELATIPATPFKVTVAQPQGIWCRDNGVVGTNGTVYTAVSAITAPFQYIPPTDTTLGVYTFGTANTGESVLISYSFIPSDLEMACIMAVAESNSYRNRIGEIEKSLGGQETIRFLRGGMPRQVFATLPPEVEALIWPYVSVIPPAIGAPL